MVMIRTAFDEAGLADAIGMAVPSPLGITCQSGAVQEAGGTRMLAWMSPDELLLFLPRQELDGMVTRLRAALPSALVEDVSDMRAGFTITGPNADDVVAKLCPVDLRALKDGTIRRTRAGQVACALWRSGGDQVTVIGFRSVADYLRGLLENAASGPALRQG